MVEVMNVNSYTQPPVNAYNNSLVNNSSNQNGVKPKTVRVKNLAANDFHSHVEAFARLKTYSDSFRKENEKRGVIANVFTLGDSYVGGNEPRNKAITAAMNLIMPDANIVGNHEFDWRGSLGLSRRMDANKFPTLLMNIKMKPGCELEDDVQAGRLLKSKVIEKNGEKFGLIGLSPSDLFLRISQETKDYSKDFEMMSVPETIAELQKEVDRLEKQGINKIFVLSHMGIDADKAIAQYVKGVDVIHGSHTHTTLKGLVPGENYFVSKRGEPVIITQAGKNGHKIGVLDTVFDEKGKIIQAKNEIVDLEKSAPSLLVELARNVMMGKPQVIGTIEGDVSAVNEDTLDENPIASFLCDSFKKYMGTDIVMTNQGGIRAGMHQGPITDEQIKELMPYFNEMCSYKFSEKEVIDTLNNAIAATRKYQRTGPVQVSGMEYTIGKDDKVKDVSIVKDDGTKVKIDSKNPRTDVFYTVGYNSYLYGGPEGLKNLHAPEKRISKSEMNETEMIINYIKSFDGKPIHIGKTGRIKNEQTQN